MKRARHTFWGFAVVAVLAIGTLSKAVASPPSALTGVTVAISAIVLVVALALAARILSHLDTHE